MDGLPNKSKQFGFGIQDKERDFKIVDEYWNYIFGNIKVYWKMFLVENKMKNWNKTKF